MNKARASRFFGIVGLIIAVLCLVGSSFMQAQVHPQGKPDKKPGKPDKGGEEATWAVEIPTGQEHMLSGMPGEDGSLHLYVNDGNNIVVDLEKNEFGRPSGGRREFYYVFRFKLVNPTAEYVEFSIDPLSFSVAYPGLQCVFPGNGAWSSTTCMHRFLNLNTHP